MRRVIVAAVLGISLSGCPEGPEARMDALASVTTKLASMVESVVRYGDEGVVLTEGQVLATVWARDPELAKAFGKYAVRVLQADGHGAVLVCSADGQRALIEDSNCTTKPDVQHWQAEQSQPCAFTLDLGAVCAPNRQREQDATRTPVPEPHNREDGGPGLPSEQRG